MDQMTFQKVTDELMRLYPQGKYAEALELVEQNADHFPEQTARTTFWRMCLLSLCARAQDVISLFQQALDSGLWWAERQFADTDLDAVRDLPEFKRLVEISVQKYREAQKHIQPERALLEPDSRKSAWPLLIALHGGGGNKESNLKEWEVARHRGWLVLAPQSTHSIYPNAYWWADDLEGRIRDIQFHLEEILRSYPVDTKRVLIGGISQGSGMAIYAALSGKTPVRGFISVAVGWPNLEEIEAVVPHTRDIRAYFVVGEKDRTLQDARGIQNILRSKNIPFEEEVHPDLGHEFPPDFQESFDKATNFIFMEQE